MLARAQYPLQLQGQALLMMGWPLLLHTLLHTLLHRPLSLLSTRGLGTGVVRHITMLPARLPMDSSFSTTMVAKVRAYLTSKRSYSSISLRTLTLLRTWGNSLSYASPDGTTGSASPQALRDTLIGDDVEIVIMTDKPCSSDDCGTVRPGTVAYRKFPCWLEIPHIQ